MDEPRRCPEGHEVGDGDTECPVCRTVLFAPGTAPIAASASTFPEFPGYDVLGKLGEGGMGEVFRARNRELQREEAIKRIRNSAFAGAEARQLFRKEAEAVAKVQHPHIVHIHLIGEAGGHPFFAMEYVDGGSLAQYSAKNRLGLRETAVLMEKVARAMNVAHQQRLVHLDLKPENVLLTRAGEPKITDFGLARPMADDDQSVSNWAGGTPGYMAPEQFANQGTLIGPAADIFGLGGTLYWLLTGRPPIERGAHSSERTIRDWRDHLRRAYDQPIVAPKTLRREIPADLNAICMACLRPAPLERYASAAALADDLGRFLRHEPTSVRPVEQFERATMWCRRSPGVAFLGILLIVAVCAGFAGITWQWFEADHQRVLAENANHAENLARIRANSDAAAAKAALIQEKQARYLSYILLADKEYHANNLIKALAYLNDCPVELRRWEWHLLNGRCRQYLRSFTGHTAAINALAFSSGRNLLASASDDGAAQVWDLDTGKVQSFTGHAGAVKDIVFDPKHPSRVISGGMDKTVRFWDADTGREVEEAIKFPGPVRALAMNPEGHWLVVGGEGFDTTVWNLAGRDVEAKLVPREKKWVGRLALRPDGKRLVSADNDGNIDVYETRTWKLIQQTTAPSVLEFAPTLAFSKNSKWLAWSGFDSGIKLWNVETPIESHRTIGFWMNASYALAFDPHQDFLAAAGADRIISLWDFRKIDAAIQAGTYAAERNQLRFPGLLGHAGAVRALAYSPKQRWLASAGLDNTVKIWDTQANYPPTVLTHLDRPVKNLALCKTGRRVALISSLRGPKDTPWIIHIVDPATGAVTHQQTLPDRAETAAFLNANGDRLLLGFDDGDLAIWDIEKSAMTNIATRLKSIAALDVSADGSCAACAQGGGLPAKILLYDQLDTGQRKRELAGHASGITCLAFAPDGKRLASAGIDGVFRIWDVISGAEIFRSEQGTQPATDIAWSPDGKQLTLVYPNHRCEIWSAEAGALPHLKQELLGLQRQPSLVRYSPDGSLIVIASQDLKEGELLILDAATGLDLLAIKTYGDTARGLNFHPDGRLFSAGSAGDLRVWDGRPKKE